MSRRPGTWDDRFEVLLKYVDVHGDSRVPRSHQVDGFGLGRWVHRQRLARCDGTLTAERRRRLDGLPGWSWDDTDPRWGDALRLLYAYVERHGDAHVPYGFVLDGFALGHWVSAQRSRRSRGRLDADRERRLAHVPGWAWDARKVLWENAFRRLRDYAERHGDASVPLSYTDDQFNLGEWVHNQRCAQARGELDAGRCDRLAALPGWSWRPFADRWDEHFDRLAECLNGHGDAQPPGSHDRDGHGLGAWVRTQRRNYAMGVLDDARQRRLEQLPGWAWGARPPEGQ